MIRDIAMIARAATIASPAPAPAPRARSKPHICRRRLILYREGYMPSWFSGYIWVVFVERDGPEWISCTPWDGPFRTFAEAAAVARSWWRGRAAG